MAKLTMIVRLTDRLPLAEGLEQLRENNNASSDTDMYKHKAKDLLQKLTGFPSRMSLRCLPYCFHYIVEDGVCYVSLFDASYPRKLAFLYLEDLKTEFRKIDRSKIETASKPYAFIRFDVVIQRVRKLYADPRTQRNLSKLNDISDNSKFQQILIKEFDDFVYESLDPQGNAERSSRRICIDIESAMAQSDVLQRVALKWMPMAVVVVVMCILFWSYVILRED